MKQQKETVTLTVAQAIIKYLSSQYIEIEGKKVRLCGGGFGIFGHGNVTCLGEALFENKEKLQSEKNCLIIANHSSHMDVFLMLIANKKPFMFVGKKELYSIPLFGYIYKRAAIMVDRSDPKSRFEVYGKANEMLKRGYNVCIFPESHYLDDTILLADFKRGAFNIAIDNKLPIIPLVFYDLKLKHPWYPKFGSLGKLRVKVLDKINVDGLKEEDIPMLTKKAFDTIKVELENDPREAAIKATEKWKKILA